MIKPIRRRNGFKAPSRFRHNRSHQLGVALSGDHTVAVTITGTSTRKDYDTATVDLDILDLSRVITAAGDPLLRTEATVRGANGTVYVDSYSRYSVFRNRSYENRSEAAIDIEAEHVEDLRRFLDRIATSHPLAGIADDPSGEETPDRYETTGIDWASSELAVAPQGDLIVVRAARQDRQLNEVEEASVPLSSFARLAQLAGGDIPGRIFFDIVRGRLFCRYDRQAALTLVVATDEIDGNSITVELDIEQVQELRRMVSVWWSRSISSSHPSSADPEPGATGPSTPDLTDSTTGELVSGPERWGEETGHSPGIDSEVMDNALRSLDRMALPPGIKGLPAERDAEPWTPEGLRAAGLNALRDLPTPFALLRQSSLRHNAEVMARYCADKGVLLAPHGKTTMAPALWKLQFETGTWALTVALPHQAVTAHRFGIRRILLANEAADIASLEQLVRLAAQPEVELYCFVDSVEVVQAYRTAVERAGVEPAGLRFLVDIGVPDGRTGCRSRTEAEAVAREIERSKTGVAAGVGAYEGPAGQDRTFQKLAAINAYVDSVTGIFRHFDRMGAFAESDPPILTIGGSDVFDIVQERVQEQLASVGAYHLVLRSGCYLVHDHGHYAEVGPSSQPDWPYTPFRGSLVVGATVVSRPQANLALLNVGRRDIGFDAGRPSVIDPLPAGVGGPLPISKLNDQHAFVPLPDAAGLPVGSFVQVGVSHPCTTLDKWRVLMITDHDHNIVDAAATIF